MSSTTEKIVDFLLIGAIAFFGFFLGQQFVEEIPPCMEDEVIVGVGNFKDGYWDGGYMCIHFKDVN